MSKEDRWLFNRKFNSQRSSHGLLVVSIDPQQHTQYLGNLKRTVIILKIVRIMEIEKGHRYVESDITVRHTPLYNPFRFKWTVSSRGKRFERFSIDENAPWESQIPTFGFSIRHVPHENINRFPHQAP